MKKDIKRLDNLKKNIAILLACWIVGLGIFLVAYMRDKGNNTSKTITSNINSKMNMYVIDTKGDAVLLESGGNFILMDTGCKDSKDTVISYVNRKISKAKLRGDFKSLSLYITEFDDEHIGEVNDVFDNLDVDTLYVQNKDVITAAKDDSEVYKKLLNKYDSVLDLASPKTEVITLKKGMEIVFGDAKITVLAPLDNINISDYENYNDKLARYIDDTSLVSIVTVGETRYLTAGNISNSMEKRLVDEYEANLGVDIYKLSNYGTKNSNSIDFLKVVNPDYSIKTYSKKSNNYINDAVNRAMYYGAVYSTDYNSDIQINILNDNISIYPDKNSTKLNVYYETDKSVELSNKIYNISKRNTLTEKWDFFVTDFEGYELDDIQYGKTLTNITSSSYGVSTFKGIEDINNNLDIVLVYRQINPEKINLNSSLVKLDVGDSMDITATVEPSNAKYSKFIWKSADEKIATVKDGKITGESVGKTTITVSIKDTNIKAVCEVIVGDYDPSIEGINLSLKSLTIDKDSSFNLNDYEGNNQIVWSVGNPNIVRIDSDGMLTPLKNGTTVITATLNGYTDRCKVTVTDGLILANITANTKVSEMINKLKLTDAKVLGSYVKYKNEDDIVATGDSLLAIDNNKVTLYKIAVIGDINGEGQVDEADYLLLKEYIKGNKELSKPALKAADVNSDGKINNKDLKKLKKMIKNN